jgi:uncharacterized membrane protein YuzA (DUF378 family)
MSTKLSKNEKRFYVAAVIIASIGAINWGLSIMGVNLLSVVPNRSTRMAIYGIIGIAGVFAFYSALRWASKKDSEEEKQQVEYYNSSCYSQYYKLSIEKIISKLDILISKLSKQHGTTYTFSVIYPFIPMYDSLPKDITIFSYLKNKLNKKYLNATPTYNKTISPLWSLINNFKGKTFNKEDIWKWFTTQEIKDAYMDVTNDIQGLLDYFSNVYNSSKDCRN